MDFCEFKSYENSMRTDFAWALLSSKKYDFYAALDRTSKVLVLKFHLRPLWKISNMSILKKLVL